MTDFEELANDVASLESRVSAVIFEAVRAQLRDGQSDAKELERRLSKVRRSLQKAEYLLRQETSD